MRGRSKSPACPGSSSSLLNGVTVLWLPCRSVLLCSNSHVPCTAVCVCSIRTGAHAVTRAAGARRAARCGAMTRLRRALRRRARGHWSGCVPLASRAACSQRGVQVRMPAATWMAWRGTAPSRCTGVDAGDTKLRRLNLSTWAWALSASGTCWEAPGATGGLHSTGRCLPSTRSCTVCGRTSVRNLWSTARNAWLRSKIRYAVLLSTARRALLRSTFRCAVLMSIVMLHSVIHTCFIHG